MLVLQQAGQITTPLVHSPAELAGHLAKLDLQT
ncbi:hypothetical protein CYB_0521 [Synechococcus sp. JA-2-3B'a(2-13)]|nr:hypothetical protein CYB_0521 [Synechococcus sp. JA-2-3B'a(2-13)]